MKNTNEIIIRHFLLKSISNKLSVLKDSLDIKKSSQTDDIVEFIIRPKTKNTKPASFCIMSPQKRTVIDAYSLLRSENVPIPRSFMNILKKTNIQIEFTENFKRHGVAVRFIKNRMGEIERKGYKISRIE